MKQIKLKITLREKADDEMYLHQKTFALNDPEGKPVVEWATTIPAGFPIIKVHQGVNKGKWFIIDQKQCMDICQAALEYKPKKNEEENGSQDN